MRRRRGLEESDAQERRDQSGRCSAAEGLREFKTLKLLTFKGESHDLDRARSLRNLRRHGSHQLYVRRNLIGFSAAKRLLTRRNACPPRELRLGCFLASEAAQAATVLEIA
jgi:hypothetical protein